MMKKTGLLLSFLLLISMGSFCQVKPAVADTVLPEKVVKGFLDKYPGKADSNWIKDGDDFIVTFTSEGKWYDVRISTKGKWLETIILINYEDMPASVKAAFEKSEFATYEQLKIDQVESEKTPVFFRMILLSKSEDEVIVKYDASGNKMQ